MDVFICDIFHNIFPINTYGILHFESIYSLLYFLHILLVFKNTIVKFQSPFPFVKVSN